MRDGILYPTDYENDPSQLAVGMTCAMIGAWFLVTTATYFSLPVSTTHAISNYSFPCLFFETNLLSQNLFFRQFIFHQFIFH